MIRNSSLSFARSKNDILNTKTQPSLLKFFPIIVICNILYLSNYLVENKSAEPNSYFISISRSPTALENLIRKLTFWHNALIIYSLRKMNIWNNKNKFYWNFIFCKYISLICKNYSIFMPILSLVKITMNYQNLF
jgi:hypothetical protein